MIWVDQTLCKGCGACVEACPDGFVMRDGKSVLVNPTATCLSQAMTGCPVVAIRSESVNATGGFAADQPPMGGGMAQGGVGRGVGRGMGRGLGRGPRDGRGRGRGGGGRRG